MGLHDVLVQISLCDGRVFAERTVEHRLRVREHVLLQLVLFVKALLTQIADERSLVYSAVLDEVGSGTNGIGVNEITTTNHIINENDVTTSVTFNQF